MQIKPLITLAAGSAIAVVTLVWSAQAAEADWLVTAEQQAGGTEQPEPAPTETPPEGQPPPSPEPEATPGEPEEEAENAESSAPRNATYAGPVDGDAGTVAIAVEGEEARAYVCDGVELEIWLEGEATGGEIEMTASGGAEITATYGEEAAAGTLTTDDGEWTFDVPQVEEAPSGLYRAEETTGDGDLVIGWIVEDDDTRTGVAVLDGEILPAPPLNLETRSAVFQGTEIDAVRIGADS